MVKLMTLPYVMGSGTVCHKRGMQLHCCLTAAVATNIVGQEQRIYCPFIIAVPVAIRGDTG
jgi:hypothetical protein